MQKSKSPRTDAVEVGRYDSTNRTGLLRWKYLVKNSYKQYVPADFARQLEREIEELKAANEKVLTTAKYYQLREGKLRKVFHNYPNVASHQQCLEALSTPADDGFLLREVGEHLKEAVDYLYADIPLVSQSQLARGHIKHALQLLNGKAAP